MTVVEMTEEANSTELQLGAVESALRDEKQRINQEIRSYPAPIPACDAQFNYLLEKRDRVTVELARLHAISGEQLSAAEQADALSEFLAESQCL